MKKRTGNIITLIIFTMLCAACNRREQLNANEYAGWMSRNSKELTVTAKAENWFCSLAYLPAEWLALREAEGTGFSSDEIKKLVESYKPLQYYVLKLSAADTSGTGELTNNYFPFEMQKEIFLVENNDTIACTLYHFENTFPLTGEHTFNIGFENRNNNNEKKLILKTRNIAGTEIIIAEKVFRTVPELL